MSPKSLPSKPSQHTLLKLLSCSIATTMAVGLLISAPGKVTGQTQQPQSTQQYEHPYFWASFIPSGNWREMTRD
ncbi:MAG: hypothetical protein AAF378_14175 [Cyanobacteria bacterium P01_A01_bin.84]